MNLFYMIHKNLLKISSFTQPSIKCTNFSSSTWTPVKTYKFFLSPTYFQHNSNKKPINFYALLAFQQTSTQISFSTNSQKLTKISNPIDPWAKTYKNVIPWMPKITFRKVLNCTLSYTRSFKNELVLCV